MSIMGALWWALGLRSAGWGLPVMLLGVAIGGGLAAFAWRRSTTQPQDAASERRGKIAGYASAGEGLAVFIAVNVLNNTGHGELFVPVLALIVGGHFFPMAALIPSRRLFVLGVLFVALGAVGLALHDPTMRTNVVCAGASMLLWGASLLALAKPELDSKLPGEARTRG